jgi:hypothetical protein
MDVAPDDGLIEITGPEWCELAYLVTEMDVTPDDGNFSITLGNWLEQLVESSHAAPIA